MLHTRLIFGHTICARAVEQNASRDSLELRNNIRTLPLTANDYKCEICTQLR